MKISEDRRMVERRKLVLVVDAEEANSDPPGGSMSSLPRRSSRERRSGERRVIKLPVGKDRRADERGRRGGAERRSGSERRQTTDRRRDTPALFSREEAGVICRRASAPGKPVECPRCKGTLTLRPPIHSADGSIWQVRCTTCRRCIMIRNL